MHNQYISKYLSLLSSNEVGVPRARHTCCAHVGVFDIDVDLWLYEKRHFMQTGLTAKNFIDFLLLICIYHWDNILGLTDICNMCLI